MSASLLFFFTLRVHAKSLHLCLTLCNPMDCSLPGSSVHGILQAEYWSGLPCPPPGDFPDPGIEPTSHMSPALAGGFFTSRATWEALEGFPTSLIVYPSTIYFKSLSLSPHSSTRMLAPWAQVCLFFHCFTLST